MADYNVSEAVSEVIAGMCFLRLPMQEELINYSALARFIKPMVEKRVGSKVGIEAITMALRKASSVPRADFLGVFEAMKDAKIVLQPGLVLMRFSRTDELNKKLVEFRKKIDWAGGEQMWLIEQSEEISAIAPVKHERELVALAPKGEVLSKYSGMALATLFFHEKHLDTVGVIEFIGRQFADAGVSISEIFSSHAKIGLLFDEKRAPAVYEKLSNAIKTSGEMADLKITRPQVIV